MADSQSGYTVISGEALADLPLEKLYTGYGFPNHFLVLLNIYSRRVTDVAVRPVYGIGEQSGMRVPKVIPKSLGSSSSPSLGGSRRSTSFATFTL